MAQEKNHLGAGYPWLSSLMARAQNLPTFPQLLSRLKPTELCAKFGSWEQKGNKNRSQSSPPKKKHKAELKKMETIMVPQKKDKTLLCWASNHGSHFFNSGSPKKKSSSKTLPLTTITKMCWSKPGNIALWLHQNLRCPTCSCSAASLEDGTPWRSQVFLDV